MRNLIILAAILAVAACAAVTVLVGTDGATVSEEANKGVTIKPNIDKEQK